MLSQLVRELTFLLILVNGKLYLKTIPGLPIFEKEKAKNKVLYIKILKPNQFGIL